MGHHLLSDYNKKFIVDETSDSLNLTIRPARASDLLALVDILFTSFKPPSGLLCYLSSVLRLGLYEDLRYSLRNSDSNQCVYLVATVSPDPGLLHQSVVVGAVEITFFRNLPFGLKASYYPYLSNLAIRADYRRQGIGRELLRSCEAAVGERGLKDLYLHVLKDNYPARQLYDGAGYRLRQADSFWQGWLLHRSQRLLLYKSIDSPV